MRKLFFVIAIFTISTFCFCAERRIPDFKRLYESALTFYENADYGKALKYSEDAIISRRQQIQNEIKMLETSLQPRQVVRVGNRISDILKVLLEREDYDSIDLISYYIQKKGEDFFGDSIVTLMDYIRSIQVYPEAQKLIGDVYKIEGEYDFAENYYRAALRNASVLDIPDERYEILYLLADISRLKGDEDEMETRLLNILTEDPYYQNKALLNGLLTQIESNKKDSADKFFMLYRARGFYMMKSYASLADYYYLRGDRTKALSFSALHVITGYTKVMEVIKNRNVEFEETDLASVFAEASLYADLVDWGTANDVWKSFNYLADISKQYGYMNFSDRILQNVIEACPETYCQKQAVILLGRKSR